MGSVRDSGELANGTQQNFSFDLSSLGGIRPILMHVTKKLL